MVEVLCIAIGFALGSFFAPVLTDVLDSRKGKYPLPPLPPENATGTAAPVKYRKPTRRKK